MVWNPAGGADGLEEAGAGSSTVDTLLEAAAVGC
jgi:hypothetical protein